MGIQEIWEKIKEMKADREQENEELPDDATRDKYLRSLRRERRVQMEEVEKEQLKKKIEDFKRDRTRKYLFGIKENVKQKQLLNTLKKKKEVKILAGKSLLKDRKIRKIKKSSESWLEKYEL